MKAVKKKLVCFILVCITLLCGCGGNNVHVMDAVYLGVENYGSEKVNKDNKNKFSYRFEIDGKEKVLKIDNGAKNEQGKYTYPIQNVLKEGYSYQITVKNRKVIGVEEIYTEADSYQPPVMGNPGEKTLKNFFATAMMPVGTTLYIYGGGWDWQDEGAAFQTRTIGLSDDWIRFFYSQDVNYTFKEKDGDERKKDAAHSYYPYGGYNEYYYAGLDCSGYVGWTLYNVMNKEDGKDGYVMSSTKMARTLAEKGWGKWTQNFKKPVNYKDSEFLPGDIFSKKGHIWICLGTCEDGSIVILHSTAADSRTGQPGGGPELSAIGESKDCDAYRLADKYMSKYFSDWYARYPIALKNYEEYTHVEGEYVGKFSWNLTGADSVLSDPDNLRSKRPEEILEILFKG